MRGKRPALSPFKFLLPDPRAPLPPGSFFLELHVRMVGTLASTSTKLQRLFALPENFHQWPASYKCPK